MKLIQIRTRMFNALFQLLFIDALETIIFKIFNKELEQLEVYSI